jgi:shikimate kinase
VIFLVGFMGSGKTTVGAALARRLHARFVDLDTCIELTAGCSIAEIFEYQGEAVFRTMEHRELRAVIAKCQQSRSALRDGSAAPLEEGCVVALGGGAFAQQRNLDLIAQAGAATVWLDAPPEVLLERCRQYGDARPLARQAGTFLKLYRERLPFYAGAGLRVDATAPLADVIKQILSGLSLAV